MKILIFALLLIPFQVFGLTCEVGGKINDEITENDLLIHATDILFGVIESGSFNDTNNNEPRYMFKLRVYDSLKGEQSGLVDFSYDYSYPPEDITIGTSYILAFYGDNRLSYCSYSLRLYGHVNKLSRLYDLAENENFENHAKLKRLLDYVRYAL
jgi:hypothetical protein